MKSESFFDKKDENFIEKVIVIDEMERKQLRKIERESFTALMKRANSENSEEKLG